MNEQVAPDPTDLRALVEALTYKAGWVFTLDDDLDRGQGSRGQTLIIRITTPDSYHPERKRTVLHYMPVPPAAFEYRTWRRWLLDQVLLVEQHEACEFFTIDGDKPYAPNHGPGRNPYTITEIGTGTDAKTSYRGEVNPA